MAQTDALIATLKQALKSHHLTYSEVAHRLGMSEANVKRMFASRRFTLERLEQICQLMQMDLSDLFLLHEESRKKVSQLSEQQERELVSDAKLLLVAVSVRNRLTFDEIISHYHLSNTECIKYLGKLDQLKLIDLLPNNRIKLRIDDDFRWLPNGPIERFFESQIQNQFLKGNFTGNGQLRLFMSGPLSDASHQVMLNKIQALASEFAELLHQDARLPIQNRTNLGFLLALKPWEFSVFEPLKRPESLAGAKRRI